MFCSVETPAGSQVPELEDVLSCSELATLMWRCSHYHQIPTQSSQNINWFWEVHFRDTRVRVQSADEVSECLLEDNELGEDYIWKNNLNTFETTFILFHYILSNRQQKKETGNILILSHSEEGQIDAFGSFCEGCFNCYLADRQMFDFYWENWSWSWHFEHLNNFGMKLEIQTI